MGFCSGAGVLNAKTSAQEQERLRRQMFLNETPLALTGMLQELMEIPSPPPVAPGSPPPEVQERMEELDRLADLVYPATPTSVDTPPPQRMPN